MATVVALASIFSHAFAEQPEAADATSRPNIVLIMADDMGYSDLGCYGSEIPTPNIDRLAHEGIRFTQFYNMPRCSPTRASLLTGLYSHEAGLGEVPEAADRIGGPGYRTHLNDECVTVAEVLRSAGYATYMSGKWHLGAERPHWPIDRGFDQSAALVNCCANFFGRAEEDDRSSDGKFAINDQGWTPPFESFYATDWFAQQATRMIEEHHAEKPFFLYLAFTAPHWPLQAPADEIAGFKGKYEDGWDAIRTQRFQRMKELGVIDSTWKLTKPMGTVPNWNGLSPQEREDFDTRMAVYAAMIHIMDRNVGRLLDVLRIRHFEQNTLVLFLSDNGATVENPSKGKPGAALGSRRSYHGYGSGWANVSNTPFRFYKHWVHEGGISTPFIARWPAGIDNPGTLYRHPAHLIDFMATAVDVAGAVYPTQHRGNLVRPMRGTSLSPVFNGSQEPLHADALFWEHQGNAAVRDGRWKLVRRNDGPDGWELYDMQADRTESNNLASKHPERVQAMEKQFLDWASRSQVQWPWPLKPYTLK